MRNNRLELIVAAILFLVMAPALVFCNGGSDNGTNGPFPITSHDAGLGYGDLGITCHGIGTGELEFPTDTSHIGQPESSCLLPQCHVVVK